MYVCVYGCVYVHMYVCMCLCIACVCLLVCASCVYYRDCININLCVCKCVWLFVYVFCMHLYTCMYVCVVHRTICVIHNPGTHAQIRLTTLGCWHTCSILDTHLWWVVHFCRLMHIIYCIYMICTSSTFLYTIHVLRCDVVHMFGIRTRFSLPGTNSAP